jgi:hypothetical protein
LYIYPAVSSLVNLTSASQIGAEGFLSSETQVTDIQLLGFLLHRNQKTLTNTGMPTASVIKILYINSRAPLFLCVRQTLDFKKKKKIKVQVQNYVASGRLLATE